MINRLSENSEKQSQNQNPSDLPNGTTIAKIRLPKDATPEQIRAALKIAGIPEWAMESATEKAIAVQKKGVLGGVVEVDSTKPPHSYPKIDEDPQCDGLFSTITLLMTYIKRRSIQKTEEGQREATSIMRDTMRMTTTWQNREDFDLAAATMRMVGAEITKRYGYMGISACVGLLGHAFTHRFEMTADKGITLLRVLYRLGYMRMVDKDKGHVGFVEPEYTSPKARKKIEEVVKIVEEIVEGKTILQKFSPVENAKYDEEDEANPVYLEQRNAFLEMVTDGLTPRETPFTLH